VTGDEVTIGNCFPEVGETLVSPKLGKHCPEAEGNISPTERKQFPVVTDNNRHYMFCYTS